MNRLAAFGLWTAALAFGQQPPLIIPHIADGGGWKSTIVIFNSFAINTARVGIIFRNSDGFKVAVPLNNYGTVSALELDMLPQSSVYLETAGTSPGVQVGWVEVNQPAGATAVRGYAVFRQAVPGRPDFEAVSMGIRAIRSMTFPFDNTNGFVTSFAVVSLSPSGCTISVSPIYEESGNELRTEARMVADLAAQGHLAFVSTDRVPELANRRGYLTFSPLPSCQPGGLAMVALRFNPSGAFTNLPPLSAVSPF